MNTFREHLDELRATLGRITLSVVLLGAVVFFFKDELSAIILAPKNSDFITYQLLNGIASVIAPNAPIEEFSVKLTAICNSHQDGDVCSLSACLSIRVVRAVSVCVARTLCS